MALSAILALSLTFASCANSSDSISDNGNNTGITDNNNNSNNNNSNDSNSNNNNSSDNSNNSNSNDNNSNNNNSNNNSSGNNNSTNDNSNVNNDNNSNSNNNGDNSSSTLPESVGENPIKETVKLMLEDNDRTYLELNVDGTARYFRIHNDEEETEAQFAYTYNANEKKISMKVERYAYWGEFFNKEEGQLLTYNECLSKLNEEYTVEKVREYLRELYEDEKYEENFKENFPNCNSYEEFELENMKKAGFNSFADYVETVKQNYESIYKVAFAAQTTFAYEIEDGGITLTEKFTGVKNMFIESGCHFESSDSLYGGVYNYLAYFYEDDVYYAGIPNTEKKTISFVPEGGGEKINAIYIEDIAQEKVTITFNGKKYICEFYGRTFTQE